MNFKSVGLCADYSRAPCPLNLSRLHMLNALSQVCAGGPEVWVWNQSVCAGSVRGCTTRPGCWFGELFSSIRKICTIIPAVCGCRWTRCRHGFASPGGRAFLIMTGVPGGIRWVRKYGKLGPISGHMSEARAPGAVLGPRWGGEWFPGSGY